jgi:TonB family protein
MSKSYFPHLGAMVFMHALVLMGTWHLSQTDSFREQVQRLGQGALKLQVASHVVSQAVQKKVDRVIPPSSQLRAPKVVENLSSVSGPKPDATTPVKINEGSEFGTAVHGKTDLRSLYKAELRGIIDQNKYYPPISKRLGHEGTVVVSFTLLEDGSIIEPRIESPSRYQPLNSSALEAVKKVKRFKPIPKELGDSKIDLSVPVSFKLI